MLDNTYRITINNMNKKVQIVAGQLTDQGAAEQFIKEYKIKVGAINASNYELEIDCKEMKVVTPQLAESLENAFRLYQSSNFKKVTFIIADSALVKMQYSRLARSAGLNNPEFKN